MDAIDVEALPVVACGQRIAGGGELPAHDDLHASPAGRCRPCHQSDRLEADGLHPAGPFAGAVPVARGCAGVLLQATAVSTHAGRVPSNNVELKCRSAVTSVAVERVRLMGSVTCSNLSMC